MTNTLSRLFRPKSIAVIGGGAWCEQVIRQSLKMGFSGAIYPVHPKAVEIAGVRVCSCLNDLPTPPDASFIGVNRHLTIDTVKTLADMGAGGAVCFAAGFSESTAEDATGSDLQAQLVAAAGDMPILGPNCYGFINALDGALLWPDQHGCAPVVRGVAILTQSSNIAINLTQQRRALPIAYTVACGNMAQTNQAQIALSLLDDPRVTAIGLHIEGFSDLRSWETLSQKAKAKGIPLIALKVGKSAQAQKATISHTASLAGGDAGASALLTRLGIARVHDLPTFLETLKLLHMAGPLTQNTLASISCSGGEASLAADTAHGREITFPPLNPRQKQSLTKALGPMVALANPLDYNTYIWRDTAAMTTAWSAIVDPQIALTLLIVDYPHTDATDWECATQAALNTRANTGANIAMVATLPELMPPDIAARLMAGGVVPMHGLTEAIAAAEVAANMPEPANSPLLLPGNPREGDIKTEAEAKSALAAHGLTIPISQQANSPQQASEIAATIPAPLVLKGQGIAHKSEAGAVRLNLAHNLILKAATEMPTNSFLIEEMIPDGVAELLVGVTRDPAHGFCLTLAAGGTLTELLKDSVTLLVPASQSEVIQALTRLNCYPLLTGFRGKPAADIDAILSAVDAIQSYVLANGDRIEELDVNPLICAPTRAVAADALIKEAPK